jgi:hypothetical protein
LFCYTAYEVGIHSEILLPGLTAAIHISQDVIVRLQSLGNVDSAESGKGAFFLGETPGVATFLVRDGNEIIVDPAPTVDPSILSSILLGPIFAVLLRQRGFAVVHASGVMINDGAVAFVGQSGRGKSTLAEAFYKHGYGVITDDVMAVSIEGSRPEVLPAYPSIKLYPESARALECENSATHRVNSRTEKRAHSVASGFPQGRLPLRRMYVLSSGENNAIEPLQLQEAFVELVRNARAMTLLKDAHSRNAHLQQCSRLAAEVPTLRLRRRLDLSALSEIVELIENDLADCR